MRSQHLLLVTLVISYLTFHADGASYIITIPKEFRPGEDLVVNVQILNANSAVHTKVSLLQNSVRVLESFDDIKRGSSKNIVLKVPSNQPSESYKVQVQGSGGLNFLENVPIKYTKATIILIQTDRGMYAKNENVRSRTVFLQPSLRTYTGTITIQVYDSKNKLVHQWIDVSCSHGVFVKDFQIGSDPELGTWKIRAYAKGQSQEKTFVVRKYVLPKFKVDIDCVPKQIDSTTDHLKCTVQSRYTFGKDVKGTVHFQAITENDQFLLDTYRDIDRSTVFKVPLSGKNVNDNIEVVAQVGDTATGTTVTNVAVVTFRESSSLSWRLEPHRQNFYAGLPFVTYIRFLSKTSTTVQMEVKILEETIQECKKKNPSYQYRVPRTRVNTIQVNVDSNGYGRIALTPGQFVKTMTLVSYSGTQKKEYVLQANALQGQGIIMQPNAGFVNVGSQLSFILKSNMAIRGTLGYQVFARGYLVAEGRVGAGNRKEQTINIRAKPSFYPRADVLVYLIQPSGDVLLDRASFEISGNPLNNHVSLTASNVDPAPGQDIKFTVGSKPDSIVYLLSVDEGVKSFQTGYDITTVDVFNRLMVGEKDDNTKKTTEATFISDGYITPPENSRHNLPTICIGKSNRRIKVRMFSRKSSIGNIGKVLSDSINKPAVIGGDGILKPVVADKIDIKPTRIFKKNEPRVWFPKTWLWESVFLENGSLNITRTVPDSMTTWTTTAFAVNDKYGLGMLENPLEIRAFKNFFLEVSIPDFVVVGSAMAIKITIFNYTPNTKTIFLQMLFKDKQEGVTRTVEKNNSTLVTLGLQIRPTDFGKTTITVIARDLTQGFAEIDKVQKPIVVKPPGIEQEYNIPTLISMKPKDLGMSNSVTLTLPKNAITATKKVYVTVTGDIMVPSINGLENLIRLPTGCGEQTMMYLAPNIYVYQYLRATNQLTAAIKQNALQQINRGIDKELTWRRSSGAFSVWGVRDRAGSTWLTSFVLRCFHIAKRYIKIEENIFTKGIAWLSSKQQNDGSFRDDKTVIHYHMLGGVRANSVTMTAYILLTFLENTDIPGYEQKVNDVTRKAVKYILSNVNTLNGNHHGLALTAYALKMAGNDADAQKLHEILVQSALGDGQSMYWKEGCQGQGRCKRAVQAPEWKSPNSRARPIDVETAAYALLYVTLNRNINDGMLIVKWLTSQRNPRGGFISTQDTVVSLQAMTAFTMLLGSGGAKFTNLNVDIRHGNTEHRVQINNSNRKQIQRIELPDTTDSVQVSANGNGIAVADIVVKYSMYTENGNSTFGITTTVDPTKQTFDTLTVKVCVARRDNVNNGMVVVEVGLPSGFKGDVDKSGGNVKGLRHVEADFDSVNVYFDTIGQAAKCFDMTASRVDKVTQSEPMPVYAYDYYEPENYGLGSYHSGKLKEMTLCSVCTECSVCQDKVIG